MPRARIENISSGERHKILKEFWTTIALLESEEEIRNFFKDLLSESEAFMLARRLLIAKHLSAGNSYDEIQQELKTSPTTIASVHAWFDGGFGGYASGIIKLKKELERQSKLSEKDEKARDPFSLEHLKKKYPLHFLLFNVADSIKYKSPKKLRKNN